ncbi:50S ribosomal protein L24 [Candidatus Kaiserbacteria bacterium]|nr:50S ribosomal protein L24 [Candidatus Kaiserbacteria bacterium]
MKIRKGDKVVVIAGKSRGQTGSIARVFPKESTVLIDGVNLVTRHMRRTGQARKGQIIQKPVPLHVSNVQLVDPKTGKPTRIQIVRDGGERTRVAIKSGQTLK